MPQPEVLEEAPVRTAPDRTLESDAIEGEIRHKSYQFHVKAVSDDGLVEGYASVTGVVDSDNEVIDAGGFAETLAETNGVWPILWNHDVSDPRGWNMEAREDATGLYCKWQLMLSTEDGRKAHEFCKLGLKVGGNVGLSIGFKARKSDTYTKDGALHFTRVYVREHSICVFQANRRATVTVVKREKKEETMRLHFKAETYATALQEAQDRQALYEEKWRMNDALQVACEANLNSKDLTPEERKENIRTSYAQYGQAMANWYARCIDMMDAQTGSKSENPVESGDELTGEKGGKVSAKHAEHVSECHAKGMSCYEKAMKNLDEMEGHFHEARKGMRKLIQAGYLHSNDTNADNPVGGGKSEKAPEDAAEVEATKAALQNLSALFTTHTK